jgi:hypothetical protein
VCGIFRGIRRLEAAVILDTDKRGFLVVSATNMLRRPLDRAGDGGVARSPVRWEATMIEIEDALMNGCALTVTCD